MPYRISQEQKTFGQGELPEKAADFARNIDIGVLETGVDVVNEKTADEGEAGGEVRPSVKWLGYHRGTGRWWVYCSGLVGGFGVGWCVGDEVGSGGGGGSEDLVFMDEVD